MSSKKRILFLINEIRQTCGITSSVFNLLTDSAFRNSCEIFVICGGGDAVSEFRNEEIEVIVNGNILHQKRNIPDYILAHFQLGSFIKKYKIDIVHSHHYYAASIARNLQYFFGISTIFSCHGLINERGMLDHFPADHVIAVNPHIYDYILSRNIKLKNKTHLIRYGLPDCPPRERYFKNEKIKFLAASRIEYEKGLDTFIKAVSLLPEEYLIKADFSIAGKGNWMPEMIDLINASGAKIKYLGNLTDLGKTLESNDVFVMPSRSQSEGFPMTIIEAAFKGNLVITSDFPGSESVIEDSQDALVFGQNDYPKLSEKMKNIIDGAETYCKLIENFRNKARRLYNISKAADDLCKLYESVGENYC